jgi:hypothetical protein
MASPQPSEEQLRSRVVDLPYPRLATFVGVQGEVSLIADSNRVTLLSGPGLLVQAALENAKSLGLSQNVHLTYHFVLSHSTTKHTSMTVKRGDAFDRFFLRMFGLKTEKIVQRDQCVDGADRPNDLKVSDGTIEIWVNAGAKCAIVD